MRDTRVSLTLYGTMLMVAYTLLITLSDAITKYLAQSYKAPQLLCIVALFIALMSLGSGHLRGRRGRASLHTRCPKVMLLRSALTVLATVMFFHALASLQLAQVFLFIALIPLMSALMSGPILGEHVHLSAWVALGFGFLGVLSMFEVDLGAVTTGHICAFIGSLSGTLSIVLARYIGRIEDNALAQVFYPQSAVFVTMLFLAPLGWKPMPVFDIVLALSCALVLFSARLVLVIALRHLTAYAVTPLMNIQFVWMVLIGMVVFNEVPDSGTLLGVLIVMASGVYLVYDQMQDGRSGSRLQPVPVARSFSLDFTERDRLLARRLAG